MKIGIIEIYSHHVFVHTLGSLLINCNQDVTIFTTQPIYNDLAPHFNNNSNKITWVIKGNTETDWHFLNRIKKQIDTTIDLLFINTIQGKRVGLFYFFNPSVKIVFANGRISEWFDNKYKLLGHDSFRRFLHHNYSHFFVKKCLPRYLAMIVHTQQAYDFARKNNYDRQILLLPFSLYKGYTNITNNVKKTKFIVTGSLDVKREHMRLLDAFEEMWSKGRDDISLTILSSPKTKTGKNVINRLKLLKKSNFDITYFEKYIPENIYLKEAETADFFVSPLNKKYYSCGELTSGIVEAIRQGKPGIYPKGYLPDPNLKTSSLFYNGIENLHELLEKILDDDSLRTQLSVNAIENSENYSLERITPYFKERLKSIL